MNIFQCKICNSILNLNECESLKSKCIFTKEILIRYKCQICGVLFGTINMIEKSFDEIKNEYNVLDSFYKEGNTTDVEIKTFLSLNPNKNGVYLNYGCGNVNTFIETLRAQEYNVYAYEPFLIKPNKYIFNSKSQMSNMLFDGIISHNVIEHFQNPLSEFIFMKSKLKDINSRMAHSTPCYLYKYEFSKYHLFFFVDNSINFLCKNSGLVVLDKIIDNNLEYINYIYGII